MVRRRVVLLSVLFIVVSVCGCEKEAKKEVKPPSKEELRQNQEEEIYEYTEKEYGIVLTKYKGDEEEIEIPEEIDGKTVIGLENTVFQDCKDIKSVYLPPCIEQVKGETFASFPNVKIKAYRYSYGHLVANEQGMQFEDMGENTAQAQYVELYEMEDKQLASCVRLYDGDSGKEGEYSEGASFAIKNGVATLTLDNFHGGFIYSGYSGALTIELAEGSENSITAAPDDEGIVVNGKLTIQGNGSLSVKAGDDGSGMGIYAIGNLTVQDQVHMYVKAGETDSRHTTIAIGVTCGDIKIANARVEAQVGAGGQNMAICAYTDYDFEHAAIELEGVNVAEGGQVCDIVYRNGEMEQVYARSFGNAEKIPVSEDGSMEGISNYVRIE